jgi:hypothetical protein
MPGWPLIVIGEPGIHLGVDDHGAVAPAVRIDGRAFAAGLPRLGVEPEMAGELDWRLAGISYLENHILGVGDFVPHLEETVRLFRFIGLGKREAGEGEIKGQRAAEHEQRAARER